VTKARWSRLLRSRYQIAGGLILAVLLPALIRTYAMGVTFNQATQYNTIIGSALALILGFLGFRRLHIFPGISSGGYIITSVSMTYALLAAALFFFRLDYSRLQFMSSFGLTLAFFIFIHIRFVAHKPVKLGFIVGPSMATPPAFDRVVWFPLESPSAPLPAVEGVVADLNADHGDAWSSRIADFALEGIPVYHVRQAAEQLSGRIEIDHLAENTLGSLNPNDLYLKVKALIDALVSMVLLILLSPILLSASLLIKLDSRGPVLFRQQRTGFRARPFTVYKFRTMYVAGESPEADVTRLAMTQDRDPRITRVGAVLRRTRIDEIPQLINVILGEMSLIGPRPEAMPLTRWYEREIPFYHYRHIIKPGITGWAQVNQGHVANVEDVRTKLNLDFYYVKNFSVWLDVLIVIRTLQVIFTGHGAK
jgi:lipopolysaccharide/colanic/teichoic acid biosynthesis glycosyltransferase